MMMRTKAVPHGGVLLENIKEVSEEELDEKLREGIPEWRKEKYSAAWLHLEMEDMRLAPIAAKHGFRFHRAKGHTAVMYNWLREDLPDKVPVFGNHQVGCGAFVLNEKNELLLIKEKTSKRDRWKMPGGLLDCKESMHQGVCREVFEETGIKASFESVLAFWQRIINEDLSDIYMVCRLCAEGDQEIKFDEQEIRDATWMPVAEYLESHHHPVLRTVLKKSFSARRSSDLNPAQPFVPLFELRKQGLQVYDGAPEFDSYFAAKRKQ